MKITVEVVKSKSLAWPLFIRQFRRVTSYRVEKKGKTELHVADFALKEFPLFDGLSKWLWEWQGVSVLVDGEIMNFFRAWELYRDAYIEQNPKEINKGVSGLLENESFMRGNARAKGWTHAPENEKE